MSTTLPDVATSGALEPVTRADLVEYFHRGGKPEREWRVGAELETFVVERATGRQLSYDEPGGIRELLQALVDPYGWQPHYRGERLTLLSRDGATVSLEPGWPARVGEHLKGAGFAVNAGPGASLSAIERDPATGELRTAAR